jgi:diguanylate cyclase (GGDEF)-like protein
LKALIADDDHTSRQILEAMLKSWGYSPVVVADGLKVMEAMAAPEPPALLMLDWEMPGLDGLSLTHHISENHGELPVYIIMLTARTGTNDIVTGLSAGANDYIAKPYIPEILKARLDVARRTLELQFSLSDALKQLAVQASIDVLTGLKNRRVILDSANDELARSQRNNSQLCIGICDIDYFKHVNDLYGHAVGDAVLRETAQLIQNNLRPFDLVGRYGGEEFLFVISADKRHAEAALERIRRLINEHHHEAQSDQFQVTMSFGARMIAADDNISLHQAINDADEALYQAKGSGRNRVVFSQESQTGLNN